MRYGRLLAEANPDRLLSSFNMNTIEDVFLNLCEKEDSDDKMLVNGQISDTKKQSHKELNVGDHLKLCETISFATYTGRKYEHIFSWIRVMAIIIDSFTFMRGKFFVILITCLLPTMQIFLFHYSIGKPVNVLPIAVTTTENRTKSFSNLLIDRLEMKNVQVVCLYVMLNNYTLIISYRYSHVINMQKKLSNQLRMDYHLHRLNLKLISLNV